MSKLPLTVEFDQARLFGRLIQVGQLLPKQRFHFVGQFNTDCHDSNYNSQAAFVEKHDL
jgi:hypothetical protein